MNTHFREIVIKSMDASAIVSEELIQTLWSGYGEIVKVGLSDSKHETAILKYIVLPQAVTHPRGWNTQRSHQRKIKSYEVEMHWYQNWSHRCHKGCRVANCYAASSDGHEHVILLEDLDAAGFSGRADTLHEQGVNVCLDWLAQFHATFMSEKPHGLWSVGTYWHLETRPDEWAAMADGALKHAAATIDQRLNACRYQTLLHGDAKVANFCFSPDYDQVAAVDFQYVGGGCGMKDVAYFLGSCLTEQACMQYNERFLDYYFSRLKKALAEQNKMLDWPVLEREWRSLFPVAWTDFYRFLLGWMPNHRKINRYTQKLADEVLSAL